MNKKKFIEIIVYILTFSFSVFAGYIDYKNSGVGPSILFIMVISSISSIILPKNRFLLGLIGGGGIFIFHLSLILLKIKEIYPIQPNIFSTLIAIIPSYIGIYIGYLLSSIFKYIKRTFFK